MKKIVVVVVRGLTLVAARCTDICDVLKHLLASCTVYLFTFCSLRNKDILGLFWFVLNQYKFIRKYNNAFSEYFCFLCLLLNYEQKMWL